jgi:hypothetical protein
VTIGIQSFESLADLVIFFRALGFWADSHPSVKSQVVLVLWWISRHWWGVFFLDLFSVSIIASSPQIHVVFRL